MCKKKIINFVCDYIDDHLTEPHTLRKFGECLLDLYGN